MSGIVAVFDFDKTIIECDSDNWVIADRQHLVYTNHRVEGAACSSRPLPCQAQQTENNQSMLLYYKLS